MNKTSHALGKLQGDFRLLFAALLARRHYACRRPYVLPSQQSFSCFFFVCLQANDEMVRMIPSCCCMLLIQSSRFKFIRINTLTLKSDEFPELRAFALIRDQDFPALISSLSCHNSNGFVFTSVLDFLHRTL
jgi:hypothetical protein